MGGGGNWEVGWEDKMLFAMVVAYGRGSVCEFILVRVGSCSKMIFQGRWKEGGGASWNICSGCWWNIVVGRLIIEFDMLLCWRVPMKCAVVMFWVLSSIFTWCVCNC